MCDYCGAEFLVTPRRIGSGFVVIKHQRGATVILDAFDTEIAAEAFAAQLHQDRLEEHDRLGQFRECSQTWALRLPR